MRNLPRLKTTIPVVLPTYIEQTTGKSLVSDTEIAKIHALGADNQDLSGLVVKETGKSLVADSEISKIHSNSQDHTHSNASTLNSIQEALTTTLKNAYDGAVSHSGLTTGIHGVGEGTIAKVADITASAVGNGTAQWNANLIQGKTFPTLGIGDHNKYPKYNNDTSAFVMTAIAGGGDVIGPETNSADYIPQWSGTNSKTLKEGLAVPAGGLAGLTALGGKADVAQTLYIGTTQIAINRASAALTIAGITLTTPDIGTPTAGNLANCSFPTLNQNTSGSAATLTTSRSIGGRSFNGSADILADTWTNGITTKNTADVGTVQDIAHGLGRVPSFVRLEGRLIVSASQSQSVTGVYNGTTNSGISICFVEGSTTASTDFIYTSTTQAIGFTNAGATSPFGGAASQTGIVTVDATNIKITWTKTGTITGTASILWACT